MIYQNQKNEGSFPTAALSASGTEGMISARNIKAPHFFDTAKLRRKLYVCKHDHDYIVYKRFYTFATQYFAGERKWNIF